MRTLLFIILSCLCCGHASAQQTTLSGQVTDKETGEELISANIFSLDKRQACVSEIDGTFTLAVDADTKQIVCTYIGYQSDTISLADINLNAPIDISLRPNAETIADVLVIDKRNDAYGIQRLRQVEGVAIYASKKNELIPIQDLTLNKSSNLSRQVYAKVSGLHIWESDGAGVQLGIGGRGLNPSRNSNFNTRQNGYDISADALGYPESYYSPPIEAIERIELIRGAASLQYGTQFGGMLNFKFKEGETGKPFQLESKQTAGSFGFLSSFNSIKGDTKKINYYAFYEYKQNDGWRPNSELQQHTAYAGVTFKLSPKFNLRGEYTFTTYLTQQAGGLTDFQFADNPRQSNRERNWFQVDWNLFALNADYKFNDKLKLNNKTFALIGGRDALGNLDNINTIDFGGNRDFLSDDFSNIGNETRLLYRYTTLDQPSVAVVGARIYQGLTHRRQGEGDDGSDANFVYNNPENLEGSDFMLPSYNLSLFAENVFNLSPKWSVTPGVRYEFIRTQSEGSFRDTRRDQAGNIIFDTLLFENKTLPRDFVFFGIGSSYKPNEDSEIYANFSENYRAINFNDIRVNVGSLRVDENLQDENGFNAELGYRGKLFGALDFDVAVYHLFYRNRIGNTLLTEPNPEFNNLVERTIRFRTNIADANIVGLESLLTLDLKKIFAIDNKAIQWSIFSNISVTQGRYVSEVNPEIDGKDVELIPPYQLKFGTQFKWDNFSASAQYSFTKEHFSDASNAILTPTAIEGLIPSYEIADLSLAYQFKWITVETGANNLFDAAYFTRRASGYPGPGIIPSTGRYLYLTIGVRLF